MQKKHRASRQNIMLMAKLYNYRFRKASFAKMFRFYPKALSRRFANSAGLKSVFEKLHFLDGLV